MPCQACENGKWQWGNTGPCEFESEEECAAAHEGDKAAKLPATKLESPRANKAMQRGLSTLAAVLLIVVIVLLVAGYPMWPAHVALYPTSFLGILLIILIVLALLGKI